MRSVKKKHLPPVSLRALVRKARAMHPIVAFMRAVEHMQQQKDPEGLDWLIPVLRVGIDAWESEGRSVPENPSGEVVKAIFIAGLETIQKEVRAFFAEAEKKEVVPHE